MTRSSLASLAIILAVAVLPGTARAQAANGGWHTIEIETTQVTEPDVTVSPNGEWLIFTMLGHLFRVPVEGGVATQLTFGPYQDRDPVFSPDGRRVAFGSNRDGSDGNIYTIDLANGAIVQVTHDTMAGRPAWAPDGREIAYLRLRTRSFHCPSGRAGVARVALDGGSTEHVSGGEDVIGSTFYLPDGRLAWAVSALGSTGFTTRIDALVAPDSIATLDTLDGAVDRVMPDGAGRGFYGRGYPGGPLQVFPREQLVFHALDGHDERLIATLAMPSCEVAVTPSIAVAPSGDAVYLGEAGGLWRYPVSGDARDAIPFRAKVAHVVRESIAPHAITAPVPGVSRAPRAITHPGLSADSEFFVFGAADYIWRQSADGGPAERLVDGPGHQREPALSPGGRRLLFVAADDWEQRVQILELETGAIRTLATGLYFWDLAWSRDGARVVFGGVDSPTSPPQLMVVDLEDGAIRQFTVPGLGRLSRPQFSAEGEWVYYSAQTGATLSLHRLPLAGDPQPQEFITSDRHLRDPLVTPDARWLAFRRNTEIWLARLDREGPIKNGQIRRASRVGGDSFSLTPDGHALVYAAGGRVWRQGIEDGKREEIPIQLEFRTPTPVPLLVRHVRMLDFTTGGFGAETSMYLEGGRIRWIGSDQERSLPEGVNILDGGGRFAIPGLFDMHSHATADASFRAGFQEAWLAYGVTSIREAGNDLAFVAGLADRSEATADPVPRYVFSGDVFHGPMGPLPWESFASVGSFSLADEADVRTYVQQWSERGVHFIKTHPSLSWPLQHALVDEAQRLGLPVMEHGKPLESLLRSVTLGSAFVEHFDSFFDDVVQLLAAAGTGWTPTLTLDIADVALLEPGRIENPKLRAFAVEGLLEHQRDHYGNVDPSLWRARRATLLSVVGAAYRAGVRLYMGTDAALGPVPGASLHRELRSFVDADIPPLEVLRIATQRAAEAVGTGQDLGTLEVGKLADIVLLDANPLEDIENTKTIWRVIKNGFVFDPEELRPERN